MEMQDKRTSDAQIRAVRKYESTAYDKWTIRIRKDRYPSLAEIKRFCHRRDLSINGFIMDAITEKMDRISAEDRENGRF